jgi:putative membrane protein
MHIELAARRIGAASLLFIVAGCAHVRMPWDRPARTAPTDATIAGIELAANSTDISYARLAPDRAQSAAVQEYAARMLTDHTAIERSMRDLLDAIRLDGEESPVSLAYRDESTAKRAQLRATAGRTFDLAYIDNEVAFHTRLVDLLEKQLVPNAHDPQLRQALASIRTAEAAHLAHAERVRAGLR